MKTFALGCWFLLALSFSTPAGSAAETKTERLERQMFEAPQADSKLYHLRIELGGKDAIEKRWIAKFESAEGSDKERWALLLAMNASPPHLAPDIARSQRWLEQAGDGWEAHTFRATIASMANDLNGVIGHLKVAFRSHPDVHLLDQIRSVKARIHGRRFTPAVELAFWQEAWESAPRQTLLDLEIAYRISALSRDAERSANWIQTLETRHAEKPGSNWVEAAALTDAYIHRLEMDRAHGWLEKAREAGAPAPILLKAEASLLTSSGVDIAYYGYTPTYSFPHRDSVSAITFAANLSNQRSLTEKVADYIENEAELILGDPLALLSLTERFQRPLLPGDDRTLEKEVLKILKTHCQKNSDDLEARFVHAYLLGLTEDLKLESAKRMAAFLRAAFSRVDQPVAGPNVVKASSSPLPFGLRFPPHQIDEVKPEPPEIPPSTFAFATTRRPPAPDTPYPNHQYAHLTSYSETVGDLVLAGLLQLLEGKDHALFQQLHSEWLDKTKPSLRVRCTFGALALRQRPGNSVRGEIVAALLAAKSPDPADLVEILSTYTQRLPSLNEVRRVGKRLVQIEPANQPAVDSLILRALCWSRPKNEETKREAATLFAKIRKRAKPGNEQDDIAVWQCSRRLSSAFKDDFDQLPQPEVLTRNQKPEDKDADYKRLVNHFKPSATQSASSLGPLALYQTSSIRENVHLMISPGDMLPGQTKDVMFTWGMNPIDPALYVYDRRIAYHPTGFHGEALTPKFMERLTKEVGEGNRRLAVARSFYDGKIEPGEQLRRLEKVVARFPEDSPIKVTAAAKAMSCGEFHKAIEFANAGPADHGSSAWLRHAILLVSARGLGEEGTETAREAARALARMTWDKVSRDWLADHFLQLGDLEEAAAMRKTPDFLPADS